MSVCIVAEYPFPTGRIAGGAAVGAIICTDTKVTTLETIPRASLAAKQRPVSDNIVVCYTSGYLQVTTAALNDSVGRRVSLRRLGRNLRAQHEKWGGYTELIAVIWHRDRPSPQISNLCLIVMCLARVVGLLELATRPFCSDSKNS